MSTAAKCHLCRRRTDTPVALFDGRLILCSRDTPDPLPAVTDPETLLVVLALDRLKLLTEGQLTFLRALAKVPPVRSVVKRHAAEVKALRRARLVQSTGPACKLTPLGKSLMATLPAAPADA